MGEYLKKYKDEVANLIFLLSLVAMATVFLLWWVCLELLLLSVTNTMIIVALFGLSMSGVLALTWNNYITKPLELIASALGHLDPGDSVVSAPQFKGILAGRELVEDMTRRIYDLASKQSTQQDNTDTSQSGLLNAIFDLSPTALVGIDSNGNIIYFNQLARNYIDENVEEPVGKPFNQLFNLSFSGAQSFDDWTAECRKDKVTHSNVWQRVKSTATDASVNFFDMAAYFSRDEPHGLETLIALIDNTQRYAADDDSMSYVALAVHELRTPVTVLRGYIEVFEQELGEKLDKEMMSFMKKMDVSASQLAMFINNILNVSRIENNQMNTNRVEVNWRDFVKNSVEADFDLRARVHGRSIKMDLPENIATVAADPISMYEVVSNLLDNAIKYSNEGGEIELSISQTDENTVQTIVRDHGIGIPQSVIGNLFEKFYRSHRSRQSVGGTGLGLYLSKTIVEEHGGQIQVQSIEGQGATFSFTLPTYASVAEHIDEPHNKAIERGSHGWIKNHSLHRR